MEKIAFARPCFPMRQPKGNGNSHTGKAEQQGRVGNALLSRWVSGEPASSCNVSSSDSHNRPRVICHSHPFNVNWVQNQTGYPLTALGTCSTAWNQTFICFKNPKITIFKQSLKPMSHANWGGVLLGSQPGLWLARPNSHLLGCIFWDLFSQIYSLCGFSSHCPLQAFQSHL